MSDVEVGGELEREKVRREEIKFKNKNIKRETRARKKVREKNKNKYILEENRCNLPRGRKVDTRDTSKI